MNLIRDFFELIGNSKSIYKRKYVELFYNDNIKLKVK